MRTLLILAPLVAGCVADTPDSPFLFEVRIDMVTAGEVLLDGQSIAAIDGVVSHEWTYESHGAAVGSAPLALAIRVDGILVEDTTVAPTGCAFVCESLGACEQLGLVPVLREVTSLSYNADRSPRLRTYCFRCDGPEGNSTTACD